MIFVAPASVAEWIKVADVEPITIEFALPTSSGSESESADRSDPFATPPTVQSSRNKKKYSEEMPLVPWLPKNGWRIPGVQKMPLAQVKVHN